MSNDFLSATPAILSTSEPQTTTSKNKKFQGEIYFGLFKGLKILNHGFGDRHTLISGKFSHRVCLMVIVTQSKLMTPCMFVSISMMLVWVLR